MCYQCMQSTKYKTIHFQQEQSMATPPYKEPALVPKTCIPCSKGLPPAAPAPFVRKGKEMTLREKQIQTLLKENLELAEENEKLRYEITYESQQRDILLKQNMELKARMGMIDANSGQTQEPSSLTYSASACGDQEEKLVSFCLSRCSNESRPYEKSPEKLGRENDTVLPTEEEMYALNAQRCSIKKPKAFTTKKGAYFLAGLLAKTRAKRITEETPSPFKGQHNEYYKEVAGIIAKNIGEGDRSPIDKNIESENPEVLFQTEDMATTSPAKELSQTPYKLKQETRLDKISVKVPSTFIAK
eukprot:TRINITY_DN121437_c0_g1_i1.p2 TRINITY_DN121437_c0_g1~~TRINITY_DN121437_c0_g1_i1.p2  ORF type:complete len:301 (-),score=27.21 TRINITY_DN121437_c0_g1_i1:79-981(-)